VATWWPSARSRQVVLKQAQVTLVAMRLCRMRGLVVDTADEVLDGSSGETMLMRQAVLCVCSLVLDVVLGQFLLLLRIMMMSVERVTSTPLALSPFEIARGWLCC